jgi:hypothetical protein
MQAVGEENKPIAERVQTNLNTQGTMSHKFGLICSENASFAHTQ